MQNFYFSSGIIFSLRIILDFVKKLYPSYSLGRLKMECDEGLRPPSVVVFSPQVGGVNGRQTPPMSPLSFSQSTSSPYSKPSPKRHGPPRPESSPKVDVRSNRRRDSSPQPHATRLSLLSDVPFDEIVLEQVAKTPELVLKSKSGRFVKAGDYDCPEDEILSTFETALITSSRLEHIDEVSGSGDLTNLETTSSRHDVSTAADEKNITKGPKTDEKTREAARLTPPTVIVNELVSIDARSLKTSIQQVRKGYDDDMAVVKEISQRRGLLRVDPPGRQRRLPSKSVERRYDDRIAPQGKFSLSESRWLSQVHGGTPGAPPGDCETRLEQRNDEPVTPPGTPLQDEAITSSPEGVRTESDWDEQIADPSSIKGMDQVQMGLSRTVTCNPDSPAGAGIGRESAINFDESAIRYEDVASSSSSHSGQGANISLEQDGRGVFRRMGEVDKIAECTEQQDIFERVDRQHDEISQDKSPQPEKLTLTALETRGSIVANPFLLGALPARGVIMEKVGNEATAHSAFVPAQRQSAVQKQAFKASSRSLVVAAPDATKIVDDKPALKRRGKLSLGFLPIDIESSKETAFGNSQKYGTRRDHGKSFVSFSEDPFEIALEDAANIAVAGMRTLKIVGRQFENLVLGPPCSGTDDDDSSMLELSDELNIHLRKVKTTHAMAGSQQGGVWWVERELAKLERARKFKAITAAPTNSGHEKFDEKREVVVDDNEPIDDSAIFILNDLGQIEKPHSASGSYEEPTNLSLCPSRRFIASTLNGEITDQSKEKKGERKNRVRFNLPSSSSRFSGTPQENDQDGLKSMDAVPDEQDEGGADLYPELNFFSSKPCADEELKTHDLSAEYYALDGMLSDCEDILLGGFMGDEKLIEPVLTECDDCMFGKVDAFDSDDECYTMNASDSVDDEIIDNPNVELFVSERICLDFSGDEDDIDPSFVGFQASVDGLKVTNVRTKSKSRKTEDPNVAASLMQEQPPSTDPKSKDRVTEDDELRLVLEVEATTKERLECIDKKLANPDCEAMKPPFGCELEVGENHLSNPAESSDKKSLSVKSQLELSDGESGPASSSDYCDVMPEPEPKEHEDENAVVVGESENVLLPANDTLKSTFLSKFEGTASDEQRAVASTLPVLLVFSDAKSSDGLFELGVELHDDAILQPQMALLPEQIESHVSTESVDKNYDEEAAPAALGDFVLENLGSNCSSYDTTTFKSDTPMNLIAKDTIDSRSAEATSRCVQIFPSLEAENPSDLPIPSDTNPDNEAKETLIEAGLLRANYDDVAGLGGVDELSHNALERIPQDSCTFADDSYGGVIVPVLSCSPALSNSDDQTIARNLTATISPVSSTSVANVKLEVIPDVPATCNSGVFGIIGRLEGSHRTNHDISQSNEAGYRDGVRVALTDDHSAAGSCDDSASAVTGSSDVTELQSNTTPILVKSLDDPIVGIAKGDIVVSLLNGTVQQVTLQAKWAGQVQDAIWRSRTMRRNFDGHGRDFAAQVIKRRSSLPIDVDEACVAGGIRSIGKTEEAIIEHLKVSCTSNI